MTSENTEDEGVILQSNRSYSSALEQTDESLDNSENSQQQQQQEEDTDQAEELLVCSLCEHTIAENESTRFVGDSCPECFKGYLEEDTP